MADSTHQAKAPSLAPRELANPTTVQVPAPTVGRVVRAMQPGEDDEAISCADDAASRCRSCDPAMANFCLIRRPGKRRTARQAGRGPSSRPDGPDQPGPDDPINPHIARARSER